MDSLILQILACVLAADVVTGVIHWWEDAYGDPAWPLLGPHVVEPNLRHHERPREIGTASTVVSRNYQTVLPAIAVGAVAFGIWGWSAWPLALVAGLASLGNEVHTWAHRSPAENGRMITFLQAAGIVLTPQQHARHHKPPYDRRFCTLTNVGNAVCDELQLWRALEWLLARCGVPTKRMSPARRGF